MPPGDLRFPVAASPAWREAGRTVGLSRGGRPSICSRASPFFRIDMSHPDPRASSSSPAPLTGLMAAPEGSGVSVLTLAKGRRAHLRNLLEGLSRRPTLVNADIGMRDALQIRYHTGNKLVLHDNNKVVGILGDSELYHALLGKNLG